MVILTAIAAFILGYASAWMFACLYVRAKRNQWYRQELALRTSAGEYKRLADTYHKLYLQACDPIAAEGTEWEAAQGRIAKDLMEAKGCE